MGWIFLLLPACAVFSGGNSDNSSASSVEAVGYGPEAIAQATQIQERPSQAERVLRALALSYPDRIGEPEFLDGDWAIEVYGERFYYAGGRFLPASLRHRENEFSPLLFYSYQEELQPWTPPTAEESERMRAQETVRREQETNRDRPQRSHLFFEALWRAHNRDDAWDRVKQIRFLGYPVMVHYSILEKLSLVEERILNAAKTSAEVRQWISSIDTVDGWSWRNVASNGSRSFHAYGTAIDILPKSLGGLATYWLWTSQHSDWWAVPYNRRYHPPEAVIKAFEAFGFIWGGKWRYYDTMHFEYRPEVLLLNGLPQMNLRDLR